MDDLDWLSKHCFHAVVRREADWVFMFTENVSVVAACLWRLLEDGRIRFTSIDDGHQFGLPAPLDVTSELNGRLTGTRIESVRLHAGTLDFELRFGSRHVLQLIPDSSGYESWNVCAGNTQYIAVGGGELTFFATGSNSADSSL